MKRITWIIVSVALAQAVIYYGFEVRDAIRNAGTAKRTATLFAQSPSAGIAIIMQSTDGSKRTCPAQSMQWDAGGVLTVSGLACAPESIFRNGFEQ